MQVEQCQHSVLSAFGATFGAAALHDLSETITARAADSAAGRTSARSKSVGTSAATAAASGGPAFETAKRAAWWRIRKSSATKEMESKGGSDKQRRLGNAPVLDPAEIGGQTAECLDRLMGFVDRELQVCIKSTGLHGADSLPKCHSFPTCCS
jgi:hypothetical protein